MQRIAILGANGMLGTALSAALPEADPLSRAKCNILHVEAANVLSGYSIIINCAGDPNGNGLVNSLGPWMLARYFTGRIYHISTDCVFGDIQKPYPYRFHSLDTPVPSSPYGTSKTLGEQRGSLVTNIRTSFVGLEHGLLAWLIKNSKHKSSNGPESVIYGWNKAWWSGSTVTDVAEAIAKLVRMGYEGNGTWHIATAQPISKYAALSFMIDAFDLDVELRVDPDVVINRALRPTWNGELRPFSEAISSYANALKQEALA